MLMGEDECPQPPRKDLQRRGETFLIGQAETTGHRHSILTPEVQEACGHALNSQHSTGDGGLWRRFTWLLQGQGLGPVPQALWLVSVLPIKHPAAAH